MIWLVQTTSTGEYHLFESILKNHNLFLQTEQALQKLCIITEHGADMKTLQNTKSQEQAAMRFIDE